MNYVEGVTVAKALEWRRIKKQHALSGLFNTPLKLNQYRFQSKFNPTRLFTFCNSTLEQLTCTCPHGLAELQKATVSRTGMSGTQSEKVRPRPLFCRREGRISDPSTSGAVQVPNPCRSRYRHGCQPHRMAQWRTNSDARVPLNSTGAPCSSGVGGPAA